MPNFPLDTGSVSDNYCTQSPATKQWLTQPLSKWSNLLDPKLLEDGGEPPKSQGRGRWFDSRLWHLLSTWHKSRQVVNCLLCFGFGMSTFWLKKKKKKGTNLPDLTSPIRTSRGDRWRSSHCADNHHAKKTEIEAWRIWLRIQSAGHCLPACNLDSW